MIGTRLNRQCLEVLHSSSVKELVRASTEFGLSMGFHTMAAMVVTDHSPSLSEFQCVTNAPPEYIPAFEDQDAAQRDPVSQHCKHSSMPTVWDQKFYIDAGRGDYWEQQASYGLRSGIAVAFHLPRGRHFVFGLNSDNQSCMERRRRLGLMLDVQQFASHVQAAAFDLCMPYNIGGQVGTGEVRLPVGELDALRRAMDGLSDWVIGQAMGISETEVLLRIRRATQRLGCATRYEAALRAIRLGLVSCS
jgi:DNA-binding CsgD family transcriptional regulator